MVKTSRPTKVEISARSLNITPMESTIAIFRAIQAIQSRVGHRIDSLTSVRLLQLQGNLRDMSKGRYE
jgi:hypothetical protein